MEANKYCLKNVAKTNLKQKSKCSERAEGYVDFVFEHCIKDKSPFLQRAAETVVDTTKII